MEATYSDGKRHAEVGDIVTTGGPQRGIVVDVSGNFVTIIAIWPSKDPGSSVLLPPADDCPACKCAYVEKADPTLLAQAMERSGIRPYAK